MERRKALAHQGRITPVARRDGLGELENSRSQGVKLFEGDHLGAVACTRLLVKVIAAVHHHRGRGARVVVVLEEPVNRARQLGRVGLRDGLRGRAALALRDEEPKFAERP